MARDESRTRIKIKRTITMRKRIKRTIKMKNRTPCAMARKAGSIMKTWTSGEQGSDC
jgi:hypothetical protein